MIAPTPLAPRKAATTQVATTPPSTTVTAAPEQTTTDKNVTSADELDTSHVTVKVGTKITKALVQGVTSGAVVVEDTAKLGRSLGHLPPLFILITSTPPIYSFTCGEVGHISRDCNRGSKCYNCAGFVSTLLVLPLFSYLIPHSCPLFFHRDTLAVTVLNPNDGHVTTVVLPSEYLPGPRDDKVLKIIR